ncbi:MAG TPA: dynamin family protein [Thermoanaerobaculia bacterium]|nr:dynamin family protein [Thermoanaerobaculia bacterium]
MVQRVLSREHEELLADERRTLADLARALARFDATEEDQETLAAAVARLDELFLLVVAGEFNAGKSALINALIGRPVLEEGVTPTTAEIHVLRWGEDETRETRRGVVVVTAPDELLREVQVIDTPGTNAVLREHEAITRDFVPNADLVLFVTSADRPFTESERAFLQEIRDWGKKVVFVLNKVDTILREEDVARVESYVTDNAHALLGTTPAVFPVSARRAMEARQAADEAERERLRRESRFAALERYLVDTLDEGERVRLKLASPLGVGERLARRYLEVVDGRRDLLREDFTTLEDIERQLAVYREDLSREFRFRLADVEKVLTEVENRGLEFFDDTVRLARVFDLVNRERIKAEYERRVLADAPRQIDRRVQELIDWLVSSELRQWQAIHEHLARRKHAHADRIVGQAGGSFDFDRSRLLDRVGGVARQTVEEFDREREAARLADSVQSAVAGAALLEVGGVGLGATIAAIATSTAMDVTGLLFATTLVILGLAVIPARRRRAKLELHEKIGRMRRDLMATLTSRFDEEVAASISRLQEAISPYTRFVRAEREHLDAQRDELGRMAADLGDLRARIERLG